MLIRRLVAIAVAIASLYYGSVGMVMIAEDSRGYPTLVGLIFCIGALSGLFIAWAVACARPSQRIAEDRGSPPPRNAAGDTFIVVAMILVGSAFAFVAGKAVVTGAIVTLARGKPDILFGTNPGAFLFLLAFWAGIGILFLLGAFQIVRGKRPR